MKKKEIATAKEEVPEVKKNKINLFQILSIVLGIFIIGSAATAFYFYRKYEKITKNPDAMAQEEKKNIADKAGKLMELPDEEPMLATVTDKEKLKGQPFFAGAQNGDKVLIYANSQKAILYRPSVNKIIGVAPLTSNSQNASMENQKQPQIQTQASDGSPEAENETEAVQEIPQNAKVTIYNGTTIKGLAQSIADKITGIQGLEIGEKTNAKKNYEKTLVTDLTGNHSELVQKIIEAVGGEAGEMPEGEIKPDADILVIGGKI